MPVYLSQGRETAKGVHDLLRDARVKKGLSLREAATRCKMSAAQLSNLETGKTPLTLAHLVNLSNSLELSLDAIVPAAGTQHYHVTRRPDHQHIKGYNPKISNVRSGVTKYHTLVRPLAEPYCGKRLEPFFASVRRASTRKLPLIASEPEVFLFVLRGEMEFRAKIGGGLRTEQLAAGDAIYWTSFLAHSSRALGRGPTDVIVVGFTPRGAPDLATELAVESAGGLHPLYRERIPESPVHEVAQRIAFLRQSHGLRLAPVAKVIGISPRQLAAIEGARSAPRIDVLFAIARAFRRPIDDILPLRVNQDPVPYTLIKRDQILETLESEPSGSKRGTARTCHVDLWEGIKEPGMYPCYLQIGSASPETMRQSPGEQFLFVLQGELEFEMEDGRTLAREVLGAGDSLYLDTSVPHQLRAEPKSPFMPYGAEVISVRWNPLRSRSSQTA
jgi:transcriptional regulator with XRE-family HTH domain/quercetin dioxygenase-like cupin family protein